MITAVIERCAGIDVGKKNLSVCLMVGAADEDPRTEIRTYGTTNADLERLRQWLVDERCTHAVLESTGNYWKPIFNVLEDSLTVVLANAEDVKGRKRAQDRRKRCLVVGSSFAPCNDSAQFSSLRVQCGNCAT